uniref:Otopetrin 3 n=1 Tax=Neogobius melanostomus TaxID=47308 RepID=A0A8C6WL32_9GOBI
MDHDFTASCAMDQASDQDPSNEISEWMPSGHGLVSGLFGLNVVLLGAALLAGRALTDRDVLHWEPQLLLLFLMALSMAWMLWFLLWDARRPESRPHQDHHAGGVTVMCMYRRYNKFSACFNTYLLWAHSKDCIHIHKVITSCRKRTDSHLGTTRSLWTFLTHLVHLFLNHSISYTERIETKVLLISAELSNSSSCRCSSNAACLIFQKGFEVLYPFSMEYSLMSGCMVYVMWKNVARTLSSKHHHENHKLTLKVLCSRGVIYGLVFGGVVLIAGATVFILYQIWVGQSHLRLTAFVLFYGYHIAVMPIMSLCSLVGLLVHRFERRAHEGGHNPTRSLDVLLLAATALGQLALSYFSLVAALAIGTEGILGDLDLSYSVLYIQVSGRNPEFCPPLVYFPHIAKEGHPLKTTSRAAIYQNCGLFKAKMPFLLQLWIIPAFGVHPQFENGLGKQFFGFSCWFVLVNVGQPLTVFYRMHSVAALMELLVTAK